MAGMPPATKVGPQPPFGGGPQRAASGVNNLAFQSARQAFTSAKGIQLRRLGLPWRSEVASAVRGILFASSGCPVYFVGGPVYFWGAPASLACPSVVPSDSRRAQFPVLGFQPDPKSLPSVLKLARFSALGFNAGPVFLSRF